jgi:NAD(P)-dependent dehydrogenase (short-subunit alcohol dehydrogenase family)
MDRFLEGKGAIVTGATRGIGRAIAEALLDAGSAVAICGRSQDSTVEAVQELTPRGAVFGAACDVRQAESVTSFFRFCDQRLPRLDVLVNNAGIGKFSNVSDLTVDQWREVIDTNLNGAFYCSREALPRFKTAGGGYVINISSLAGKNAFAGGAAYNASKFGLNGFSEAMMLDQRYDNVRVSYIMPGSVNTGFGSNREGDWKIQPADIAEIVLMLLRMPARTLVSRIEVRPTRPKR